MKTALRKLEERVRPTPLAGRLRRFGPLAGFFGGFVFDMLTLGRQVSVLNLVIISLYAVLTFVALLLQTREWRPKVGRWIDVAMNFFLGSVFSALVILYFKSSGQLYSFLVVLGLLGAMVWNEFFRRDRSQRELVWAVYCLSLVMLLNFVFPYVVKSVSALWFYVSTALGVAAVYTLRRVTAHSWKTMRASATAVAALVILYAFGWIPPVPLISKNNLVCTQFEKRDGEYTCQVQEQSMWVDLGLAEPVVQRRGQEPIYVLSSVFAPRDVRASLEHRWYRRVDGAWKPYDTMRFEVRGGRRDGWRFWSRKRHIAAGLWRVETALADGAVLSYETFRVQAREDETSPPSQRLAL